MLPLLQINLLGGLRVICDGEPVTGLHAARLQALLAYLVLHRHTLLDRQRIAFLFWPETTDAQAQTNLRQLLHTLRRRLPHADRCLDYGAKVLRWQSDAPVAVDVEHFTAALARTRPGSEDGRRAELSAAVELYTGDLLPGCYDDWILPLREQFAQQYVEALANLAHLHEEQREYTAALACAQRLLRHDPLREETYRQLMRLHALIGDRAAALRVYHACVSALSRELDAPPSRPTREVYEQLLQLQAPHRPPVHAGRPLLVGRQQEWQALLRAWRSAAAGAPQLVCLWGEAGAGKTRLAEEMALWTQDQGILTVFARAYAAGARLAYAPIAECLGSAALQPSLAQLDALWLAELARLRPELLLQYPHLPRPEPYLDRLQRQHLFQALARVFVAPERPLLLVLDDLHWCDEETLDWLHYLLNFDRSARLLVLAAARREEIDKAHPLHALLLALRREGQLHELELPRLDAQDTGALAQQVSPGALDPGSIERLFRITEGNPLFIVECVRAGYSPHTYLPAAPSNLPPKVQAAIRARLGRLSPAAQELVETAAVIGRSFAFSLVAAAGEQQELQVVRGLDELWQRHIVREQSVDTYDFTHDLIRAVAYQQISPARRRLLHRRVVAALEQIPGEPTDARISQLAHHSEQGGDIARAISWLQRAAEAARAVYAHREAAELLEHALKLLQQQQPSTWRLETELELQLALCSTWDALSSHMGAEVEAAYQCALVLCRQVQHTPHLFRVLWGLHETALYRSDFEASLALARQCLAIATAAGDTDLLVQAHHAAWAPYFFLGRFDEARTHMRAGLTLYDAARHEAQGVYFGVHDPASCALTLAPLATWHEGNIDLARQQLDDAIAHAERIQLPVSKADALSYCALCCCLLRDPAGAKQFAEPALRIFREQRMANAQYMSLVGLGWSLVLGAGSAGGENSSDEESRQAGMALLVEGLELCKQIRQRLHISQILCMYAEACLVGGQPGSALIAADEGIILFRQYSDFLCAPDLYLFKGQALQALGESDNAVAEAYAAGLALARTLGAKVSELRAATSLARLLQRQGCHAEAMQLLEPIYRGFDGDCDNPELRAAAAMLELLAAPP
ncbi:MAG: AAA family ATPase [Caldilineaceae bacterium]